MKTLSQDEYECELPELAKKLRNQKKKKNFHGLYDYMVINLAYSSSRMASNRLTRAQVETIFRKGKVQESFEPLKVSDLIEVLNHCSCVDYILDFHVRFEQIFPFDDGNGRVARLIIFKECLRHGVMPFIIDDKNRSRYLQGIREWFEDRYELVDVVMDAQLRFEAQIELQKLPASGQHYLPEKYKEMPRDENE